MKPAHAVPLAEAVPPLQPLRYVYAAMRACFSPYHAGASLSESGAGSPRIDSKPLRGVCSPRTVSPRSGEGPARHPSAGAAPGVADRHLNPEELAVADKSPRQSSSKKSGKSLKQKRAEKKAAAASKDIRVVIPARRLGK